jgi:hypothetical protein
MTMGTTLAWIASAALAAGGGLTAGAQTSAGAGESGSAAAQAGPASAGAMQATSVSAELTKRIDSKDAKVGDEVAAKTTSEARMPDGTKIPRGSRLMGHVSEVQAKSKENHDSHVTFCFDHAVLKDGRDLPVNAMVRAIAAPAPTAASSVNDDPMAGGGLQGGGGGRGAEAPAGGVGLAGNGPSIARPVGLATGATSATAGGLNNATSGIDGSVNGAVGTNGALGTGGNGTALNNAAGLNGGLGAGAAGSVGNLSGVTFSAVHVAADAGSGGASATGGASIGTTLTGHNKNVSLDSGSQMMVAVAPR